MSSSVDESIAASAEAEQGNASWKSLFAFTKWKHSGILAAAILTSALSAALKTTLSIVLGQVFDIVADFGGGKRVGDETVSDISKWCAVLLGLGLGNWLASTVFLGLWIIFGELQANAARRDIFKALLSRELAWFDVLEQGISSLLVRIET